MGAIHKDIKRAFVLWLSGARFVDIQAVTEVATLVERGVMVELEPSPITGAVAQYYQVFSGQLPAYFGFFDTLVSLRQLSRQQQGAGDYAVAEKLTGRDAVPKMLPDLLRAAGWMVEYEEASPANLVSSVQGLTKLEATTGTCKIVKSPPGIGPDLSHPPSVGADLSRPAPIYRQESIAAVLRAAREWVGEAGLLAVLSDIQPAPVERFVNINNFLAEMGVIERDEGSGLINWPNSLAYHMGHGQLWVNVLGRDPHGAVDPRDEYEEVRNTLVKALPTRLRDAGTGAPVIERVYRKEELYPDEYLFCAPDLVVVFKPGYVPSPHSTRLDFDEAIFSAPAAGSVTLAGAHPSELKGFLVASAPSLASGLSVSEPAPLTSVVPSLLHALAVEHAGIDSPVISEVFLPAYLESHPIQRTTRSRELSEEDEELVINRLRDLGYV